MEPDFKGFARAWVGNDRRLADLARDNPEAAQNLMIKLAQALDNRRRQVQGEGSPSEGNLVVTVDSSRFGPQGLDSEAWDQLADLVEEHDRLQS